MSSRRKRPKKPSQGKRRLELTQADYWELLRTIHDDLAFLRQQDRGKPSRTDVRIASVILRRLLYEGLLHAGWSLAGFSGEPRVTAVDLDAVLGDAPRRYIHYAYAGGAPTEGAHHKGYILLVVPQEEVGNEGAEAIAGRLRQSFRPGATRTFLLSEFCNSPALISGAAVVTRLTLVRYIANKLGGVHWDNARQAWSHAVGSRHRLLDENHIFVGRLSAPFYELVSMAADVAASDDTTALIDRINEVAPEEDRETSTLSFREGRIGKYAEMTFAPKGPPSGTGEPA